jgi:heptosyltransferase-3
MRWKAIERRGKRLIMAFLGSLLGKHPASTKRVSGKYLRRILVVRQDERLGNVLLITPLLARLRRALPGAHVSVLVSRRFAEVLRGNADIDRILTFDKRQLLHNPLRLAALVRTLRKGSYDLAIDCGPIDDVSLNNSLLTYLSGAPLRLGHRRGESHLFLNLQVPPGGGDRPEADRHLDLLRHLFGEGSIGKTSAALLRISLRPEERARALQRWQAWGLSGTEKVVAVHVGGRGGKQWGLERFLSLAHRLISREGVKVVLFWGPGEKELVQRLKKNTLPGLYLSPLLAVRDLAAQLELCTVFVCNDTGPMHLASAVGTPTVAIFLKPNFARYGPRGVDHIVAYRPDGEVSLDDVHRAVRQLLGRASGRNSSP